jgi:hypothetical protein
MDRLIEQFKKGYKTTEFWITAATVGVVVTEGLTGLDLDDTSLIGMVGTVAAYVLSRGFLKAKRTTAVQEQAAWLEEVRAAEIPPVG